MRIFQRATDIVAANMSSFVDRFEDPAKMVRYAVHEMETTLATTSAAVARSLGAEKLLAKRRSDHAVKAIRWSERAVRAMTTGDEPLARRAIAHQFEQQRAVAQLDEQLVLAKETNDGLKRQLHSLREKYENARNRLAVFSARHATAMAQRQASAQISQPGRFGAFARFDHYCQELDLADAAVEAFIELQPTASASLAEQFDRSAAEVAIDAELARLREQASANQ